MPQEGLPAALWSALAWPAMLLADKLELQATLKQELVGLQEKELNYFIRCCQLVGLQASMVGAFAFTALTEQKGLSLNEVHEQPVVAAISWLLTFIVILLETCALVKAMGLSILTAGLALRGPDGSMSRALEVMRVEYRTVHFLFVTGLIALLFSAALYTVVALPNSLGGVGVGAFITCANLLLVCDFKRVRGQLFSKRSAAEPDRAILSTRDTVRPSTGCGTPREPTTTGVLRYLRRDDTRTQRPTSVRKAK